jgi:hypothetical protein
MNQIYISELNGSFYATCGPCAMLLATCEDDIDAHTEARYHNLHEHKAERLPIFKADGTRYYAQ